MILNEHIYIIKNPLLKLSRNKLYNKKLEVFECKFRNKLTAWRYFDPVFVQKFDYNTNEWIKKKCKRPDDAMGVKSIKNTLDGLLNCDLENIGFSSIEMAKIAKIMLMSNFYLGIDEKNKRKYKIWCS
jgi:hypothetical protein